MPRSENLYPYATVEADELLSPGSPSFVSFLCNFRHQNAFEQAEMILQATLEPAIAQRARRGEFITYLDHFDLLQTVIN